MGSAATRQNECANFPCRHGERSEALQGRPRGAPVYELEAGTLALGANDAVTVAAKRLLGIGDSMLLERRAVDLAEACQVPLEALDVGLYNWERGARARLGVPAGEEADEATLAAVQRALGL